MDNDPAHAFVCREPGENLAARVIADDDAFDIYPRNAVFAEEFAFALDRKSVV